MARNINIETIWSFGLNKKQEEKLVGLLGKKYLLKNWPLGIAPNLADYEADQPSLSIATSGAIKSFMQLPEISVRHLQILPRLIFLDKGYTQEDLEFAIDADASEIIRYPYTQASVNEKIRRALEVESVHSDVLRMSKEIILEREILERKNDILNFLVSFLTHTSASMNPAELIEMAATKLQMLFPVRNMQAAIWDYADNQSNVNVFISAPERHEAFKVWTKTVRDAVEKLRPGLPLNMNLYTLACPEKEQEWCKALPSDGHVLSLPISIDKTQFGVLLVLTDMQRSLSRDQAMALNSALRHLALSLKNAQNFTTMKKHAEFDGLTGLHNRRSFEARFTDEVKRAKRYGHPLSIIFGDIDHFKHVNDTFGHLAGDDVLKTVGEILSQSRRSSDYVARYGGEEFVMILPHTNVKKAYNLAERIRKEIATHKFNTCEGKIDVTLSFGVAELAQGSKKSPETLLKEADQALYRAKNTGRNRTELCTGALNKLAI